MKKNVTLTEKYFIRPYKLGDCDQVLDLLWSTFYGQMSYDLWKWKCESNPYFYKIMMCGTEDGRLPIAVYGGTPFAINWHGCEATAIMLFNLMDHSKYGNPAILIDTVTAYFDQFCQNDGALFLYGLLEKRQFAFGQENFGYERMPHALSFLSINPVKLCNNTIQSDKLVLESVDQASIGSEFDRLWLVCRRQYPLSVIRDQTFVRWRFCQKPDRDYVVLRVVDSERGQMCGYVAGIYRRRRKAFQMIDLLLPHDQALLSQFWFLLGQFCCENKLIKLETWLPHSHFITESALTVGFAHSTDPASRIPMLKRFSHSPNLTSIADEFYYTMADADIL